MRFFEPLFSLLGDMRYRWQISASSAASEVLQLVDAYTGQVIHRATVPAGAAHPPDSDDPRVSLQGIRTLAPAVAGSAWINELGQLMQKVGTDDLYYINGELYERQSNGSFFKVTQVDTAGVDNRFIFWAFVAGAGLLWFARQWNRA